MDLSQNKHDEVLLRDEEGSFGAATTLKGCELESENQFIKNTAPGEITKRDKKEVKLTELEEEVFVSFNLILHYKYSISDFRLLYSTIFY